VPIKLVVSDIHPHLGARGLRDFQTFRDDHGDYEFVYAGDCLSHLRRSVRYHEDNWPQYTDDVMTSLQCGMAVTGNHDNQGQLSDFLAFKDIPGKIRIMHGHQFSAWNSGVMEKVIGDPVVKLLSFLERLGHPVITGSSIRHIRDYSFNPRAFAYMRKHGLKTLIVGHTHNPGVAYENGRKLVRLGSWTQGPPYHYATVINDFVVLSKWYG